jgi:hypothetical protein
MHADVEDEGSGAYSVMGKVAILPVPVRRSRNTADKRMSPPTTGSVLIISFTSVCIIHSHAQLALYMHGGFMFGPKRTIGFAFRVKLMRITISGSSPIKKLS